MAEKIESLQDIKSAVSAPAEVKVRKPNKDKLGRAYATGKRKDAVARQKLRYANPTKTNWVEHTQPVKEKTLLRAYG